MLVYLNGKMINQLNASISIDNRSFRYGDGCFETMKLMHGKVLQPKLHTDRLFASLALLQFDCPSYFTPSYIIEHIEMLAAKNQHTSLARIRLTVFRGDGGLYDVDNMRPNLLIQSWPLNPENNRLNENGLVIDVFTKGHKACDAFSNLKSNNYLLYAMAALRAKAQHCNDLLVLNQYGRIADSTIANVWIIEKEKLITPLLTEAPVEGTMRRFLLENATKLGFDANEESISIERLVQADEVFLTNAIYGMKWVKQCGEASYGNQFGMAVYQKMIQPLFA
jgi:branched-subunit amino acid aminotransferase/4-amino-4-deoxychorismate lyase